MSAPPLAVRVESATRLKERPADKDLTFGRIFTDHMALLDYELGKGVNGWLDPRVVPYGPFSFDPAAAVLHYGQEMFDGLKAFHGVDGKIRLFRVDRHCRRMSDGAARLCMPAIDTALAQSLITTLVKQDAAWVPSLAGTSLYIRPTLVATEPFLGVRPSHRYLFFVIASPVGAYHGTGFSPARIWIEDTFVRAATGGLGAVKAGANYVASLLAAEEAKKRGYDQVLWTDASEHGRLEEVGTMNLMAVIGDELVTPGLDGTILGGITRDSVLTLARRWGIKAYERHISVEELLSAQRHGSLKEVFGCGTAAVITPVGELAWKGEKIVVNGGQPGPLATRFFEAITAIQYGREADPFGWTTEVV